MDSFSPKVDLPAKDERILALLDSRVGTSSPWELIALDVIATKNEKLEKRNKSVEPDQAVAVVSPELSDGLADIIGASIVSDSLDITNAGGPAI